MESKILVSSIKEATSQEYPFPVVDLFSNVFLNMNKYAKGY